MERTIFLAPNVNIHALPARNTSRGTKAQDWDPNPVWTGKLKLITGNAGLIIRLEDGQGQLFAECPVNPGAVEGVSDSSRYFVLRVVDPGLGFTERTEAFDFAVALQDSNRQETKKLEDVKVDYRLKEGEMIKVNLNVKKTDPVTNSESMTLLPPPPSNRKVPSRPLTPVEQPATEPREPVASSTFQAPSNWETF